MEYNNIVVLRIVNYSLNFSCGVAGEGPRYREWYFWDYDYYLYVYSFKTFVYCDKLTSKGVKPFRFQDKSHVEAIEIKSYNTRITRVVNA